MQLNEKHVDDVFKCLKGLKDKNECIRALCEKSLEIISTKLNDKQLDRVFNTSYFVRGSCAESLGVISINLTDKQLEGVFNDLPNEQEYNYFGSYKKSLEEISTKWNERQSEIVFNALIFVSKDSLNTNNDEDKSLVELFQLILTKLNGKQLYLLVVHLLERAKKRCARGVLSKIFEDMWKRVTVCELKENIQMKNENTLMNKENSNNRIWKTANDTDIQLLAFGLMTFNPRIQLSCDDDNTNFDALDELIKCYDKQAIEWKFPTHQSKWNNSNIGRDIQYPSLNNVIKQVSNDENAHEGCYTVVHEAARLGDLSQFKLVLQSHPDIDINDSCNEHRQTPLYLAINNEH
ncbi:hypothetical protein RFI_37151 [Reticulomyxa filosa]|uniref:Uncharacterized protein n=1 Tax=Reticulomyxa filosa TaxID=46433 RepID=X6LHV3_RETFI|nr:hypothetical protein RFI_37151 [Reticulomyxa filosa]|eukprot:ETO00295.1 hypothetical protein RFI_37151 [Reticulomyxa filosa]